MAFSVFGNIWRSAVKGITNGLIDPFAMAEHKDAVQAAGGNSAALVGQAIGNGVMSYQQGYMASNGQGTFNSGVQNGVQQNLSTNWLPYIGAGIGVLALIVVIVKK
jgi:hypothetical protein